MMRSTPSYNPGLANRNKRSSGRINVSLDAIYEFNGVSSECLLTNLSVNGAALKVPQYFTEGDNVHLSFEMPGKMRISVSGKVRYMRGSVIGVQFLDVDERTRDILEAFVKRESSKMLFELSKHRSSIPSKKRRTPGK